MGTKYLKRKVSATSSDRDAAIQQKWIDDSAAIRKKWADRGDTGSKMEEAALDKVWAKYKKSINAEKISWKKDLALIKEHGKDAPKARSFMTDRKKKKKTKVKKKSGGSIGRGMGVALRGGGSVTRG